MSSIDVDMDKPPVRTLQQKDPALKLSEIDQARFGVMTAKAAPNDVVELERALADCESLGVQLLILRISSVALGVVQAAEKHGALVMDSLTYYEKTSLFNIVPVIPWGAELREATPDDAGRVGGLAALAFENYGGHYHADPRLRKGDADKVYSSWASSACVDADVADSVLILQQHGELIGFAALKAESRQVFDCCLLGVSPSARRKGVSRALLQAAERWGRLRGFEVMTYSTQITNVAVQRGLCKAGFLPFDSCYTLHKWFA